MYVKIKFLVYIKATLQKNKAYLLLYYLIKKLFYEVFIIGNITGSDAHFLLL